MLLSFFRVKIGSMRQRDNHVSHHYFLCSCSGPRNIQIWIKLVVFWKMLPQNIWIEFGPGEPCLCWVWIKIVPWWRAIIERKATETRRHGFQIQKFVYILVNYRICEFGLKFRVKIVWVEIADQTEFRGPSCFHGNAGATDLTLTHRSLVPDVIGHDLSTSEGGV